MEKMSNVSIDKENGVVRLTVDTKFYGASAIIIAAKEYLDSCWMYVDGDPKGKMLVTLKPKNKDIDLNTLGYEFYNFMLGLIQDASS